MWQRFTERARRVVFFAQEEAGRLGENYVSTEHLLLGLVRENDSVAAQVLQRIGVSCGQVRSEVERRVERGDGRLGQDMQLTPRAKRVIDLAYDEARLLNNNYIGTEHLLLGLIREREGVAGQVLHDLGVLLEPVRDVVMRLQDANRPVESDPTTLGSSDPKRDVAQKDSALNDAIEAMAGLADVVRAKLKKLLTPGEHVGSALTETEQRPTIVAVPGDVGVARAAAGQDGVELALDSATFERLDAAFITRDRHGYRELTDGDQTVRSVSDDTPLRILVAPTDLTTDIAKRGLFVRVLDGELEGQSGWIFRRSFERVGADLSVFPPPDAAD